MKKFLAFVFLIAAMTAFGVEYKIIDTKFEMTDSDVFGNNKVNVFEAKVSYPVFKDDKINSAFRLELAQFLKDYIIDEREFDIETAGLPYTLTVEHEVSENKNGHIVVLRKAYAYTGGAHGSENETPLIFDNNGKKIKIEGLFTKDQKRYINGAIGYFAENRDTMDKNDFKDTKKMMSFPINKDFDISKTASYLTDTDLVVIFQPYDVGPYSDGVIHMLLDRDIIDKIK